MCFQRKNSSHTPSDKKSRNQSPNRSLSPIQNLLRLPQQLPNQSKNQLQLQHLPLPQHQLQLLHLLLLQLQPTLRPQLLLLFLPQLQLLPRKKHRNLLPLLQLRHPHLPRPKPRKTIKAKRRNTSLTRRGTTERRLPSIRLRSPFISRSSTALTWERRLTRLNAIMPAPEPSHLKR